MTLVGNRQIPLIFLAFYLFSACDNLGDQINTNYLEVSGYAQGTSFSIIYNDDLARDFSIEIDSMKDLGAKFYHVQFMLFFQRCRTWVLASFVFCLLIYS